MSSDAPKNTAGSGLPDFRAYPVDQAVAIIRAIAEHRWPISLEEAFALRDQFGWRPAPDNGRFYVTSVSNGEEDGSIGVDRKDRNHVSRFRFNLTTRVPVDAASAVSSGLRSAYVGYVDALTALYGVGEARISKYGADVVDWFLPSRTKIHMAMTSRFIAVNIESPRMAALTETEERYFAEGGD